MSAKHTPGPWGIIRYTNYEGFSIQSETEPLYGCIAERWEDTGRDEARGANRLANARLIAAAPELLEAHDPDMLEAIANEICDYANSARVDSLRVLARKARAAITKATGEEPS